MKKVLQRMHVILPDVHPMYLAEHACRRHLYDLAMKFIRIGCPCRASHIIKNVQDTEHSHQREWSRLVKVYTRHGGRFSADDLRKMTSMEREWVFEQQPELYAPDLAAEKKIVAYTPGNFINIFLEHYHEGTLDKLDRCTCTVFYLVDLFSEMGRRATCCPENDHYDQVMALLRWTMRIVDSNIALVGVKLAIQWVLIPMVERAKSEKGHYWCSRWLSTILSHCSSGSTLDEVLMKIRQHGPDSDLLRLLGFRVRELTMIPDWWDDEMKIQRAGGPDALWVVVTHETLSVNFDASKYLRRVSWEQIEFILKFKTRGCLPVVRHGLIENKECPMFLVTALYACSTVQRVRDALVLLTVALENSWSCRDLSLTEIYESWKFYYGNDRNEKKLTLEKHVYTISKLFDFAWTSPENVRQMLEMVNAPSMDVVLKHLKFYTGKFLTFMSELTDEEDRRLVLECNPEWFIQRADVKHLQSLNRQHLARVIGNLEPRHIVAFTNAFVNNLGDSTNFTTTAKIIQFVLDNVHLTDAEKLSFIRPMMARIRTAWKGVIADSPLRQPTLRQIWQMAVSLGDGHDDGESVLPWNENVSKAFIILLKAMETSVPVSPEVLREQFYMKGIAPPVMPHLQSIFHMSVFPTGSSGLWNHFDSSDIQKEYAETISHMTRAVIHGWIYGGYDEFNQIVSSLNKGEFTGIASHPRFSSFGHGPSASRSFIQEYDALRSAILNAPKMPSTVFAWRGVSVDLNHAKGDIVVFNRFTACTPVYEVAKTFATRSMYLVELPPGSIALNLLPFKKTEAELLLPDRCTFVCEGLLPHEFLPSIPLYHLRYVGLVAPTERQLKSHAFLRNPFHLIHPRIQDAVKIPTPSGTSARHVTHVFEDGIRQKYKEDELVHH